MFVRRKKNKGGVLSIQVIEKRNGKSCLVKTIGSSREPGKIVELLLAGRAEIVKRVKQLELELEIRRQAAQGTDELQGGSWCLIKPAQTEI